MGPAYLADLVVAIHVGYVAFVVVGQLAIVAGLLRGWAWVRNPWFRWTHLVAIVIVATEALLDIPCPLTVWEQQLRASAGQTVNQSTFVGRMLHEMIFFDAPAWVFTIAYVGFALLVGGTFYWVPPRHRP